MLPRTKNQIPALELAPKVVMIGGTGAVEFQTAKALVAKPKLKRLTLLGRRPLADFESKLAPPVQQATVDLPDPRNYESQLQGRDTAICTVGRLQ